MSTNLDEQVAWSKELRESARREAHDRIGAAYEKAQAILGTSGDLVALRDLVLLLLAEERKERRSMWVYSVGKALENLADDLRKENPTLTMEQGLRVLVAGIRGRFTSEK